MMLQISTRLFDSINSKVNLGLASAKHSLKSKPSRYYQKFLLGVLNKNGISEEVYRENTLALVLSSLPKTMAHMDVIVISIPHMAITNLTYPVLGLTYKNEKYFNTYLLNR